MDDLINRQAAISICDNAIDLWNGQLGTGALVAVRDAIMALPSAQPEVIRCKDCKHWDGADTCDVIDAPVWDDDFCSMAERRSDE